MSPERRYREGGTSGYYRAWCDTLALFYDALTRALGLLVGGEMRFRKKVASAANLRGGERVLDVGCGTGTLAVLMAKLVGTRGRVTGIDLSPRMLARARRKTSSSNLGFLRSNAERIPFADETFDVVTVTYTLHEMNREGRRNTLREIRRVLRLDGRLVVVDLHQPEGWGKRSLFKFLMLLETETAWDLVRNGLQKELTEAGFADVQQEFLYRDLVPATRARKRRQVAEATDCTEGASAHDVSGSGTRGMKA